MTPLRSGDLVEVRDAAEILATLDEKGELESLPFMPEMLGRLGARARVYKRADKVCDTIQYTGSRRIPGAVFLDEPRCTGGSHEGCQAACRVVWKEAWLRPVEAGEPPRHPAPAAALGELSARLAGNTRIATAEGTRFRCQNTELLRASSRLGTFDPRPYLREYTNGDVTLGTFLRVGARAAVMEPARKLRLVPEVPVAGTGKATSQPTLNLQPGEWVQVRSRQEIADTLDAQGRNRGLWFDREMAIYCGGTFQVRARVNRFIDERTARLIELKNDCVTLEDVVCTGEHSLRRWFCPREILPYWRECWLRRVPAPTGASVR